MILGLLGEYKCVFMILSLCVPMHKRASAFISHNINGNLIRALCKISAFTIAAHVFFHRYGLTAVYAGGALTQHLFAEGNI